MFVAAGLARAHLDTLYRSKSKGIPVGDIIGLLHNTLPGLQGGDGTNYFHASSANPSVTAGTYEWEDVNGRKIIFAGRGRSGGTAWKRNALAGASGLYYRLHEAAP